MTKQQINRITSVDIANFKEVPWLDMYQRIATKSAIYPGQGTPLGLMYVALKGAGEAGEFAEHVGKAMRDDNLMNKINGETNNLVYRVSALTPQRREYLIKEIGDELWYLSAKCNELGITLFEAAMTNLVKLKKRCDDETLQGSGDDR